jgi:hypothetical protein
LLNVVVVVVARDQLNEGQWVNDVKEAFVMAKTTTIDLYMIIERRKLHYVYNY